VRILVTGGSGMVGRPLVRRLRADGHDVVQLVRREPTEPGQARWDPAAGYVDPAALAGVDAAVNLAGSSTDERRWSRNWWREFRRSRVEATTTLSGALAGLAPRPRVLVNASATGIYGDRGDEELTECSEPGHGPFADLVRDWESATGAAEAAGIRVVHARAGIVMDPSGGGFGRLLPLFRLGLGGRLGRGRAWWSWITLEDDIGALRFLLDADLSGPVNLTSPAPARNADVTRALGRAVRRPAPFAVPPAALRLLVGPFADEVLASHRVLPRRLLEAGFAFRHPDLDTACAWLARR
jgi:hypothetical protein